MLIKGRFYSTLLILPIVYCLIQFFKNITFEYHLSGILIWIVGYSLVSILLSKLIKISIVQITLLMLLTISIISGNGINIVAFYFMVITSIVFGHKICNLLSDINPGVLYNLMVGVAVLSSIVGFLSHFPVNYAGLYVSILIIISIGSWKYYIKLNKVFINSILNSNKLKISTYELLLEGLIGGLAIVYFLIALMPEVGYDALVSHLAVPERMAFFHKWIYDPKVLIWSLGPLNANWVFTIPYIITSSEELVRITSVGFLVITCFLIKDLIIIFNGTRKEYLTAVLILITTPLTLLESSSLFTDLIWTAYLVAGAVIVFKMLIDESKESRKFLILIGIFFGMALGVKLTTLFILPPVFILYIYYIKKNGFLLQEFLKSLSVFLIIGCISYGYSYWVTGNPLFPFYNEVFKSPLYPSEKFLHPFKPGLSWDLIYQITFHSGNFLEGGIGSPGFQWILLLLPSILIILFKRNKWLLVLLAISITFIVCVFNTVGYLRYIYPAFIFLIILISIAIVQSGEFGNTMKLLFSSLFFLTIFSNLIYFKAASHYANISFPVIFNSFDRERYIESRVPMRRAIKMVNGLNLNNTPVAILSTAPYFSGLQATPMIGWWYNNSFSKSIFEIREGHQLATLLSKYNIDYILLDDSWGGSEIRELIKISSNYLERVGNISIHKFNNKLTYQYDLLRYIKFPQDWSLSDGAKVYAGKYLKVTVSSPAVATVGVSESRKLKYVAESKCFDNSTPGRLQVNWMDYKGKFISTNITTFDCEENFKSYSVEIKSPPNAVSANVYASSHTEIPVVFKSIKLLE